LYGIWYTLFSEAFNHTSDFNSGGAPKTHPTGMMVEMREMREVREVREVREMTK